MREGQSEQTQVAPTPSAKVELSERARELDMIRSELEQIPEVDEARVAKIRARIEAGDYEPDLGKAADGILQEAFWATLAQY